MHRFSPGCFLVALILALPAHAAKPPHGWAPNPFTPLTEARIEALPAGERAAWQAYWRHTEKLSAQLPSRQAPDSSTLKPMSTPPKGGIHTKGLRLEEPAAWYATEEARTVADRVVAAQMPFGAWTKGMDYTQPAGTKPAHDSWNSGTFDNDATIFELRFLARVITHAADDRRLASWRGAFERGVGYVFAAQYPNGGFPQIYPLIGGYHDGVTFNDDVMTHVLELLRDVAVGHGDYAFVSTPMREEAAAALERGLHCVRQTQLHDSAGQLTVWCQQYDPLTLKPVAARNFEPVADCSRESAALVLFLMSLPDPSPEIVASVEGAIAWFRATALHDLRVKRAPADTRGEAVPSPGAPPLWARFYEPGTKTPIFGDRDRTIHYELSEISSERIAGYTWYTDVPNRALKTFASWRAHHAN